METNDALNTLRASVSIDDTIAYLNELLALDRPAIAALIANRVPCSDALADHPSCQVGNANDGFIVGMLGLLNGLFGTISDDQLANGCGPITAIFDDDDGKSNFPRLTHFERTEAVRARIDVAKKGA